MDIIGQNGNEGLHYEEEKTVTPRPRIKEHKPKFVDYTLPSSQDEEEDEEEEEDDEKKN